MAIISAQGFSCYYKVKKNYIKALDNLTFIIEREDFVTLIGPSGSGKSTLLKCVLGLTNLVEGEMTVNGVRIDDVSTKKQNFAYIGQDAALFPNMTIYENLAFPLKVARLPHAETDKRIKEIAQETGISLFLTRKPKQLSGGQQQKVAIAKALIKRPTILLLDEPLAHIDGPAKRELLSIIKEIHEKYKPTILYTTHDLTEAFTAGTKLMSLESGHIAEYGTTQEILANPKSELAQMYKRINPTT